MSVLNSKNNSFHMVEKEDLDYVSGGARVTDHVNPAYHTKKRTDRCNCHKFTPRNPAVNFDICDNCKHACAKDENTTQIYCSADKK